MKSMKKLEQAYKPTKETIDWLILENYVTAHRELLGVSHVSTVCNALRGMGIGSLRDLSKADDLVTYKARIGILVKGEGAVFRLKQMLEDELSEEEP